MLGENPSNLAGMMPPGLELYRRAVTANLKFARLPDGDEAFDDAS
jgi:hypothetical protein